MTYGPRFNGIMSYGTRFHGIMSYGPRFHCIMSCGPRFHGIMSYGPRFHGIMSYGTRFHGIMSYGQICMVLCFMVIYFIVLCLYGNMSDGNIGYDIVLWFYIPYVNYLLRMIPVGINGI